MPDIAVNKVTKSAIDRVDFNNIPFGRTFSDHMFICDYRDGKWQSPRIEPLARFPMHPANMTLHYGQAIFEGMKASRQHDGQIILFRPEEHAARFNRSAERMAMPTLPESLFLEAIETLVALEQDWIPGDEGSALYIRPFMIATDEFIGVRVSDTYRFMVIVGPTGPYYPKPVNLLVAQKFVRAVEGGIGEAKAAGNYAASLLPSRMAQEAGYDQILWTDAHDFKYVQEVGTMNLFFVIDGEVLTPATTGAILKGITRKSIMHLLRDKGYTVTERRISIDEIADAYQAGKLQEVFGAGTAAVVSNVASITYNDLRMELPPLEECEVAQLAKKTITDIRTGKAEDAYGWTREVKVPETATVG